MPRRPITNQRLSRRETFRLAGAAGAAALVGRQIVGGPAAAQDMESPACVVSPAQTEGPYFVDELLNRSDIRIDPTDNSVQAGVPLALKLTVSQSDDGVCTPLTGAFVDIWHCNAQGHYSDVQANSTVGKKFLRGYQVTDEKGVAQFTTIYPGWYQGRTIHTHFKVRMFAGTTKTYEFTSQLYFDDAINNQVLALAPYNSRGTRDQTNATDGIYLGTFGMGSEPQPGQPPPGGGTPPTGTPPATVPPASDTSGTTGTRTDVTPPGEILRVKLTPVKEDNLSQGFNGTFSIALVLT
jgi:protocatechuate 3,4-dioxygenase beta subunit